MNGMVTIKAPTRIDIAGGTLDIWPLSLLHEEAVCVNSAIDLFAVVSAKRLEGDEGVIVETIRPRKTIRYPRKIPEGRKSLFDRLLERFPVSGWHITVDCSSPAGAGLGGSSALMIALIRTLCEITGRKMSRTEMLRLAQNIEAKHLGIPTGVQDYIASLYGGVRAVKNGIEGLSSERLKIKAPELEKRTALVYSGKSRISGDANWTMIKRALDGHQTTRKAFAKIAENSVKVKEALESGRFDDVGPLVDCENRWREKLGPKVVPARIKKVFEALRRSGAYPKVCGAGGGGCFMVWCEPGKKGEALRLAEKFGMKALDFRIVPPSDLRVFQGEDG